MSNPPEMTAMNELDRTVAALVGDDAPEFVDGWPVAPSAFAADVFARLVRYLTVPRAATERSTPDTRAALAAERLQARAQRRQQAESKTPTSTQHRQSE